MAFQRLVHPRQEVLHHRYVVVKPRTKQNPPVAIRMLARVQCIQCFAEVAKQLLVHAVADPRRIVAGIGRCPWVFQDLPAQLSPMASSRKQATPQAQIEHGETSVPKLLECRDCEESAIWVFC